MRNRSIKCKELKRVQKLRYQGIRVNSICPSMTLTDSVRKWSKEVPEQEKAVEEAIPLERMGRVEEQANTAVWLCSNKAGIYNWSYSFCR